MSGLELDWAQRRYEPGAPAMILRTIGRAWPIAALATGASASPNSHAPSCSRRGELGPKRELQEVVLTYAAALRSLAEQTGLELRLADSHEHPFDAPGLLRLLGTGVALAKQWTEPA